MAPAIGRLPLVSSALATCAATRLIGGADGPELRAGGAGVAGVTRESAPVPWRSPHRRLGGESRTTRYRHAPRWPQLSQQPPGRRSCPPITPRPPGGRHGPDQRDPPAARRRAPGPPLA